MRELFGNLMLRFSEKILGRSACFIYTRPKGNYATYRSDGHVGASPFINEKVEKEYTYHNVILNKYPYKKFSQHFLIVPKREVNALLELDPEEQYELIQIMGEYEAQGFVILSQQFGASRRSSIAHKHVHALK